LITGLFLHAQYDYGFDPIFAQFTFCRDSFDAFGKTSAALHVLCERKACTNPAFVLVIMEIHAYLSRHFP